MTASLQPETHSPIPWLRIARFLLIVLILYWIVEMAVGVVLYQEYVTQHYAEYTPNNFWNAAQTQSALAELGWPASLLPAYLLSLDIIVSVVSLSLAIFLLWRKSTDWFGLLLALSFTISLSGNNLTQPVVKLVPLLAPMDKLAGQLGWQVMFIVFYLFPDGRFVPRWTRWLLFAWLGYNFLEWLPIKPTFYTILNTAAGLLLVLSAIGSQVYRYGWHSTPLQRQQTKWVVAVLAIMMLILLLLAPSVFKPPTEVTLVTQFQWAIFGDAIFRLSFLLIPAAIAIAIFRYRLWDIDVIIRRTLQYTLLSGLLGLVYFGGVTLLQTLLGGVDGQSSPVVIVLTTLAIATLFNPLRRRIQALIDRSFYRKKYNAEKALTEFALAASRETDLGRLTTSIMDTIQSTLQPRTVSVWIRSHPKDV